ISFTVMLIGLAPWLSFPGWFPALGRAASKPGSFLRRMVIEVRLAIYREQEGAAGRRVVVQRTRFAPNVISGHRDPIVILDAAFQDKRLLDLRMFVKWDVGARLELE